MTNKQLIRDLKKCKPDTPCIITWKDALDSPNETTISTLSIEEITYDTIGFLLGVTKDYIVLAYNREGDGKTYKGLGYIPSSLVIDIKIIQGETNESRMENK